MKRSMRHLFAFALTLGIFGFLAGDLHAQGKPAAVEVILVKAGNDGEGVDSSLSAYAGTLQRLFRFKSYRQSSRQTLKLDPSGEDSISMAGGQTLTLKGLGPSGGGLKADIDWRRGSKRLLHTRINLQPGSPAVLGGPRSKEGTWLLILTLR